MPDQGTPLNATRNRYAIALESRAAALDPSMAARLIELVDELRAADDPERFLDYATRSARSWNMSI